LIENLVNIKNILLRTNQNGKKILIVGNGGSAAIASHFSVDLTKNAGIRCINFNEADLITCFSNDYGY
jgi:D-sedoheptulose 7-phosphate isomerase